MGCSPCASVGNGASVGRLSMQSATGSRRQGGPMLEPGFLWRNADLETSGSNFRRDAEGLKNLLERWPEMGDLGDLEGIRLGVMNVGSVDKQMDGILLEARHTNQ